MTTTTVRAGASAGGGPEAVTDRPNPSTPVPRLPPLADPPSPPLPTIARERRRATDGRRGGGRVSYHRAPPDLPAGLPPRSLVADPPRRPRRALAGAGARLRADRLAPLVALRPLRH